MPSSTQGGANASRPRAEAVSSASRRGRSADSAQAAGEFLVEVERVPGKSIGIDFEPITMGLRIYEVHGGLLGDWNAQHPDLAVREDDVCFEVNGVRGTPQEIVAEVKRATTLRMRFRRGRPASAQGARPSPSRSPTR